MAGKCFGEFNYVERELKRSLFQAVCLFAHGRHASTRNAA